MYYFCKTTKKAAMNVKHILDYYCRVSSQLVSVHKFRIQFQKMYSMQLKEKWSKFCNNSSKTIGTYLDCSKIYNKRIKWHFDDIKRRLEQNLTGWKSRTLSVAGKVLLVKSNRIGALQYFMIWFKIPMFFCDDTDL